MFPPFPTSNATLFIYVARASGIIPWGPLALTIRGQVCKQYGLHGEHDNRRKSASSIPESTAGARDASDSRLIHDERFCYTAVSAFCLLKNLKNVSGPRHPVSRMLSLDSHEGDFVAPHCSPIGVVPGVKQGPIFACSKIP